MKEYMAKELKTLIESAREEAKKLAKIDYMLNDIKNWTIWREITRGEGLRDKVIELTEKEIRESLENKGSEK